MKNKKHQHTFNVITVENHLTQQEKEYIEVTLECSCNSDIPQSVVTFFDNDLLSAVQNYHGWLSTIAPALVSQDFRINDKRVVLKKGEEKQ